MRTATVSPEAAVRAATVVLAAALDAETVLVSVMAANNETGALQPVAELAGLAHRHGALFHCDAAQAAGKIPLDVQALGVDLLTVVGHKMYAPKGIGALYIADGVRLEPLVYGGGQERGLRAGTENVALAVALGTAAQLAADELTDGAADRITALRDGLHRSLTGAFPGRVHLNGPMAGRLPNTLNVSIDGVLGHELLAAAPAIAASTGSAYTPLAGADWAATPHARWGRCGCLWAAETDVDTAVTAVTKAAAALLKEGAVGPP
jgi:cysteine desulfurase